MNLNELQNSNNLVYSVVAGSKLYGLDTPTSDTDLRGIFNLPVKDFIIPNAPKQISDDSNDRVYYEIARFLQLAEVANPNILELLFVPKDKIIVQSPIMEELLKHREAFLTKATQQSLGGYAVAQIKKARGQNKKIVNPCTVRKTPTDFCYFMKRNYETILFPKILDLCNTTEEDIGLSKINNFDNTFLIHSKQLALKRCYKVDDMKDIMNWKPKGVLTRDGSDLIMTSIPKAVHAYGILGIMKFNRDGYAAHYKEYLSYQDWLKHRNPARYASNAKHGKGYDSKNMMHCFRLLNMGIELAEEGTLNVVRPDRDFLLKIRKGKFDYDYLIKTAEEKLIEMDEAYSRTSLPSRLPSQLIPNILQAFKL